MVWWALWWCKQNANWTTLSYSSNCSIFSAKKLETTSTTKNWQQNLKNGKMRFRLNIDVREEVEDSRLNAIECLNKTDYVRKRCTWMKEWMNEWMKTCVINLCTFLCRRLQNNNVKWPFEMTKFCVFWRTRTAAVNFFYFNLEFNAGITHLDWVSSESNRRTEQIYTAAKFQGKI